MQNLKTEIKLNPAKMCAYITEICGGKILKKRLKFGKKCHKNPAKILKKIKTTKLQ
jgi:hypothetical protein